MTEKSKEIGEVIGTMDDIEPRGMRKVRPVLAILAGLLEFGLGYVYVGKLRYAIASFVIIYGVIALFAWTRLVMYSATLWWFTCACCLLIAGVVLIHPVILAIRNRHIPLRSYNRWWFYLVWTIAGTGLAFAVGTNRQILFGYEPFRISSASMSPTAELGDFVLADTWRYRNHAAMVGDIVIVERPENPGVKYIKRVVAVSGDSIELRDGVLYRNGQQVGEPYVHAPVPYGGSSRDVSASTLGPGLIYLLGDYRDNSMDSRQWGPFRTSTLRGRVQYIWLSVDKSRFRWDRVGTSLVP
jgi:signal peptidase I